MDMDMLIRFFMWCTAINALVLAAGTVMFLVLRDHIFRIHSRLFSLNPESFVSLWYLLLGIYKILIAVFCLIPWLVLLIIR